MELILLEDVDKLGDAGELVKVKPGFARNFLLPRGLAVFASDSQLNALEKRKAKLEEEAKKKREKAEAYKETLKNAERIVVTARAGDSGKLFGSITKEAIAEAILDQLKIEVDRHKIRIVNPINTIGEHPIKVGLGSSIETDFIVKVELED